MASADLRSKMRDSAWIKVPPHWVLHRGNGARGLEIFLTFLLMFFIYVRQLLVIFYALDTNVLPIARDVCTLYRWEESSFDIFHFIPLVVRSTLEKFVFIDTRKAVASVAEGYCDKSYHRVLVSNEKHMVRKYPASLITSITMIFVFMILPQVFYVFNESIRSLFYKDYKGYQEQRKQNNYSNKQDSNKQE